MVAMRSTVRMPKTYHDLMKMLEERDKGSPANAGPKRKKEVREERWRRSKI
jgi:hypothetical protein